MQKKTDTSQTLAEIFEEMKEEGRKEGRKYLLSKVVRRLFMKGFTDKEIAEIMELGIEEVTELRKSF